jgi:Zn-dependent M28 family amino/carboxypeptidase
LFQGEQQNATTIFNRGAAGEPLEPFDLSANKKVSFTVAVKSEPATTQNVVAVLEGGDRALKNEYVAIGAHYDHVGVGKAVAGDSIYNGADDDGSGTVAVLAMAEAFASGQRPKRSILLVWHTGEEQGLWGSKYITAHPVIPLNQIIAQLNIDMIGRSQQESNSHADNEELSGPNEIYVIGSTMMSTELGVLSEKVNKSYLNLDFNYKYDDLKDPNQFFYRSDHFNYAQKGVPIIFYFDGLHQDYHQPSDSVEKIDFQKMEKVTRTIYATAWELANLAKRPAVDKALPSQLTAH